MVLMVSHRDNGRLFMFRKGSAAISEVREVQDNSRRQEGCCQDRQADWQPPCDAGIFALTPEVSMDSILHHLSQDEPRKPTGPALFPAQTRKTRILCK